MLTSFMFRNTLQKVGGKVADLNVLMEEAKSDVKESSVGLWRDAQEEADLVVGADVFLEGDIDVFALGRGETLHA